VASSTRRALYPQAVAGDHWLGGWVGPGIGLDAVAKIKKSFPYPCWECHFKDMGYLNCLTLSSFCAWNSHRNLESFISRDAEVLLLTQL
jgi:hypothetical protein